MNQLRIKILKLITLSFLFVSLILLYLETGLGVIYAPVFNLAVSSQYAIFIYVYLSALTLLIIAIFILFFFKQDKLYFYLIVLGLLAFKPLLLNEDITRNFYLTVIASFIHGLSFILLSYLIFQLTSYTMNDVIRGINLRALYTVINIIFVLLYLGITIAYLWMITDRAVFGSQVMNISAQAIFVIFVNLLYFFKKMHIKKVWIFILTTIITAITFTLLATLGYLLVILIYHIYTFAIISFPIFYAFYIVGLSLTLLILYFIFGQKIDIFLTKNK